MSICYFNIQNRSTKLGVGGLAGFRRAIAVNPTSDLREFFSGSFEALLDHKPLRWQIRLFDRLVAGVIPRVCNLPTGLGKTSVIPIWLVALAAQARVGRVTLPRRLVYIVNRRTVVDQATSVVEQLRRRLFSPSQPEWLRHEAVLNTMAKTL